MKKNRDSWNFPLFYSEILLIRINLCSFTVRSKCALCPDFPPTRLPPNFHPPPIHREHPASSLAYVILQHCARRLVYITLVTCVSCKNLFTYIVFLYFCRCVDERYLHHECNVIEAVKCCKSYLQVKIDEKREQKSGRFSVWCCNKA